MPFYVPTPLLKLDLRALDGYRKKPILDDHRQRIGGSWTADETAGVDFVCPELVAIAPSSHRLYQQRQAFSADGHVYRRAELCCKTGRCERMKGRTHRHGADPSPARQLP